MSITVVDQSKQSLALVELGKDTVRVTFNDDVEILQISKHQVTVRDLSI